jgi:MFS family permease
MALDVAIIISWIAYHKYQPALLDQFKFTEFTLPLMILQGAILFVTPPIAGLLADRLIRKGGNRLPIITIGINFVSMVFMVVALTVFANPDGIIRLLFPVMIALWLISMNIFHSPAISTVEMFVPARKLPLVIALFAVIAELAHAVEPSIVDLIEFFGGPLTFAVGGLLVFGTGWWFSRATKNLHAQTGEDGAIEDYNVQKSNFPLVFLLGAGLGLFTMFFFEVFPGWEEEKLGILQNSPLSGNSLTSLLLVFSAVVSYPLSILVEKRGTRPMALLSAALGTLLLLGIWQLDGLIVLVLMGLFAMAYALCAVSFLPIAFLSLEKRYKIFGIGLFFSGIELAPSIWDIVQVW